MRNLAFVCLMAAIAAVAACKSTGGKTEAVSSSAQDVAQAVFDGRTNLQAALAALKDLTDNPGDLKKQFNTYQKALDDLGGSLDDIRAAKADLDKRGADLMAEWDEQLAKVNNEDIKARSEARKAEVKGFHEDLAKFMKSVAEGCAPPLNNLREIEKALEVDLTAEGVKSVKASADKTAQDFQALDPQIIALAQVFEALGAKSSTKGS